MKGPRSAGPTADALLPLGLSFSGPTRPPAIGSPWRSLSHGLVRTAAERARVSPSPADALGVRDSETALLDEEAPEPAAVAGTPPRAVHARGQLDETRLFEDHAAGGSDVPEVLHDQGGVAGRTAHGAALPSRTANARAPLPAAVSGTGETDVGMKEGPSALPVSLEDGTRRSGSERPGTACAVVPPREQPAALVGKPASHTEASLADWSGPRTQAAESFHGSTDRATSGAHGSGQRTRDLAYGQAATSLAGRVPRPAYHGERAVTPPELERAAERSAALRTPAQTTPHGSTRDAAPRLRQAADHASPGGSQPASEPRSTMGGAATSAPPARPLPLLSREKAATRRSVRIGTLHVNVVAAKARTPPLPSPAAAPQRAHAPAARLAPPPPTWADPWHGEWFRFD